MKYIKQSFADCSKCELLNLPSSILETNCKDNLKNVDVIFIGEKPNDNEIENETILNTNENSMFRKYFRKHKINKLNYLLTNVILCKYDPLEDEIKNEELFNSIKNRCVENCFNIINVCEPKLVVLIGNNVVEAFKLFKDKNIGITKRRGKFYKWKYKNIEHNIFITVHPNFVNNNKELYEPIFENDILRSKSYIEGSEIKELDNQIKSNGIKGKYTYKIPEKYYTDNYRLIDIQYLTKTNEILYIFRDKNNIKIFHKESDKFVCYKAPDNIPRKKIVSYDDLEQVVISYKDRYELDYENSYEGDIRLSVKHAMDYYSLNQGECEKEFDNIYFLDIEVDTGKVKEFPSPEFAKYPINLITIGFNSKKICYILDNKTEPIKQDNNTVEYKIFKTERSLLLQFIKDFKDLDPDFASGWNSNGFDFPYIFKRLENVKINPESFSKFNEVYVDGSRFICKIAGCVPVDQLLLYKLFTFTKQPNYKLGTIGMIEVNETKLELPLSFNEMYWKMLNLTIDYNIRDVDLLIKLENKLKHINTLNEIKSVCKTSFEGGSSSFGQVDSIVVSYLRDKGLASKNANPHIKKEKYPGAFVYAPIPGIYNHITDFDFTSLYPSIIQTYNIGVNNFIMKFKNPKYGYDISYNDFNDWPEKFEVYLDPTYENKLVILTREEVRDKIKNENLIHTINGCFYKSHKDEMSKYALILKGLLDTRKYYKGKKFDAVEKKDNNKISFYDTKQLVYKVLANSLYGVIANKSFRFFDVSCAGAITLSGQEALKHSIVYGDEFMKHLHKKKELVIPNKLTKEEIFENEMPDRKTNYIVTGDTDSIFCCFEEFKMEKTIKNIKDNCDKIQEYLNNDIMSMIVKSHNSDIEFNKLNLKNELIISRGLFLAKKRYCIRIINNEGKDVDKIVSMGLETKRSDFSSHTKDFLNELIELILKSENINLTKILKFINRKEKEFLQLIKSGDRRIAKPVRYGKKIKEYKMVPQGVIGMNNWNKINYNIHQIGGDGFLFKIQGINREIAPEEIIKKYDKHLSNDKISKGKVDVIVIPDEESKLPDYYIVDVKDMMRTTFIDRYNLMLKPLIDKQKTFGVLTM